jgi:glycosyltransferase involved in cell wall biosynthesis
MDEMERKYGFKGPYFFLPNQFWAHKNHMVVLQAVARLKQKGEQVTVLCTGNTVDYRVGGTPYVDGLRDFISKHELEQQVKILGLIDYADVLFLMRHCLAVINPSRFEGWSSSVEEAKSMGKTVILSRIDVHVEQEPADGHYFDVDDEHALAQALLSCRQQPSQASQIERERLAHEALQQRTLAFGKAYIQLLKGVVETNSSPMTAALRPDA